MNQGVILNIAKTHLLTRRRQTIVAALGVTFGIGCYIIMMSFMTGINGLLDGMILNRTPHVHIYNEIAPTEVQPIAKHEAYDDKEGFVRSIKPMNTLTSVHNSLPLMDYFESLPEVKSVSSMVKASGFYIAGNAQLNALLLGVDPEKEAKYYQLNEYVIEGSTAELQKQRNGVLLGKGIAEKLSLEVGDNIFYNNQSGDKFQLKIVGLYQSGLAEIDNTQSYINLGYAQQILGVTKSYITDINLKLHDMEIAPGLSKQIAEQYNVTAVDIQTANAQFDTGTSMRNMISYAVSITLLIVAGFGIYNILNMLIYEKMNDIAILKATGFSGKDVQRIFIYQALIIGLVGGIIGLIFGYGVSVLIDNAPFETEALPSIKTMPVNFNPSYYVIGIIFALISTFLAGYLPSKKAQRIDPVEIIRGQ